MPNRDREKRSKRKQLMAVGRKVGSLTKRLADAKELLRLHDELSEYERLSAALRIELVKRDADALQLALLNITSLDAGFDRVTARELQKAGVDPRQAARLFTDALGRVQ